MEKVGAQALWVLLVVWLYFMVKYFTGMHVPELLNTAMIVIGVAAGIGVFLWLSRHSRRL
jgi:hypothetical protein